MSRTCRSPYLFALALACAAACSTSAPRASMDAGAPDAGSDAGPADGGASDAGEDAGCASDFRPFCDGFAAVVACESGALVHTNCPAGQSCLDGACAATCTDACNLGDTGFIPDGGLLTCRLVDLDAGAVVDAGPGMEDRARLYNSYLRKWALPAGQIAQLEFTGPDLGTVASYNDVGDSAIFTGTYLAAEAFRYQATQSPDALANTIALVNTIHRLWNVAGSGSPGWLARFAVPASSDPLLLATFSASNPFDHFNGSYGGVVYDWKGDVSRDQYQGVLLGYSIAYDAVADESVRDLIRGDVVTFVNALMQTRSLTPTINGIVSPVPIQTQYVVLTDQEPLSIVLSSNADDDSVTGALLFTPQPFGVYPDPTVAIQLASAFEVALQVTQGAPAWAAQYQTIQAFVESNIDSWLNIASDWVDTNGVCNGAYYGNNIAFEPMYNLARLETDPTRQAKIRNILEQNMWSLGVENDKNSWFAYIFAANTAAGDALTLPAIEIGNSQLSQFTPPPRVNIPVTGTATPDPSCAGDATVSIDIGQRPIQDFTWQRDPKQLSSSGDLSEVYPGVDFLCAYWLARQQAFLQNDTPSRCTQWEP